MSRMLFSGLVIWWVLAPRADALRASRSRRIWLARSARDPAPGVSDTTSGGFQPRARQTRCRGQTDPAFTRPAQLSPVWDGTAGTRRWIVLSCCRTVHAASCRCWKLRLCRAQLKRGKDRLRKRDSGDAAELRPRHRGAVLPVCSDPLRPEPALSVRGEWRPLSLGSWAANHNAREQRDRKRGCERGRRTPRSPESNPPFPLPGAPHRVSYSESRRE